MSMNRDKEKSGIIKESLELEKNIIEMSLKEYSGKIKAFEKKHKMTEQEFLKKFNSGELGDDTIWFDWLFASKARQNLNEKINVMNSIAL